MLNVLHGTFPIPKTIMQRMGSILMMVAACVNLTLLFAPLIFTQAIRLHNTRKSKIRSGEFENAGMRTAIISATRFMMAASLNIAHPKKNNQLMTKPANGPKAVSTYAYEPPVVLILLP